jgi:hypothetical protein
VPLVTNLDGDLHAVVYSKSGAMVHFIYDDCEEAWGCLDRLPEFADCSPSVIAFRGQLFVVFILKAYVHFVVWTSMVAQPTSSRELWGSWSTPSRLHDDGNFTGKPVLFTLDGTLHVLCRSSDEPSNTVEFNYDCISSSWSRSQHMNPSLAIGEVSTTTFGDQSYLGLIRDGGAYVVAYADGKWEPQEDVDGQSAADPPQLAVQNGRLHGIFTDNTGPGNIKWYSRPLLKYSPSSWMQDIPDDALVSHLTIPGTHDSVARGRIPFVRTQYLTITQQLPMGIRFLDLRLRVHDDGDLYCYHGGIPAHFPDGPVTFLSIMEEVWTFLRGLDGQRPATETVLISINNDDSSAEQLADPAPFYRAVESVIAATASYPDGTPRWFLESTTPTLGEARGRAVLLRRYLGDPVIRHEQRQGLDLSKGWLDNNPEFTIITPTHIRLHLQDKWRYTQRISLEELVASKSGHVQQLMERAASTPGFDDDTDADDGGWCIIARDEKNDWFINFCSAVGDPVEQGEIAQAKWIAVGGRNGWFGPWVDGMNVKTREFVKHLHARDAGTLTRRLGIVILDYPELPVDNDLVAKLIDMNF